MPRIKSIKTYKTNIKFPGAYFGGCTSGVNKVRSYERGLRNIVSVTYEYTGIKRVMQKWADGRIRIKSLFIKVGSAWKPSPILYGQENRCGRYYKYAATSPRTKNTYIPPWYPWSGGKKGESNLYSKNKFEGITKIILDTKGKMPNGLRVIVS